MADKYPDAFARVVDRLLASPAYGERWGRHWLDVVRYADSAGDDDGNLYRYAYRFRDYIVDAFNKDLPYDQMIRQHLAGDLLPVDKPGDVNPAAIVATGFIALGQKPLTEQDKPKMLYDIADEQLDTTGRVFMGLTIGCARCHDHKFDPIPTRDYYSMASIFQSTKTLSVVDKLVSQILYVPIVPKGVSREYEEHQAKVKAKEAELSVLIEKNSLRRLEVLGAQVAKYLVAAQEGSGGTQSDIGARGKLDLAIVEAFVRYLKPNDEVRPHLEAWQSNPVPDVAQTYQAQFQKTAAGWKAKLGIWMEEVQQALASGKEPPEKPTFEGGQDRFFFQVYFEKGPFAMPEKRPESLFAQEDRDPIAEIRTHIEVLKKESPPEPPMACAVVEGPAVTPKVLIRGNVTSPGETVPKQFLQIIAGENQAPLLDGSGRLALADWLTDPKHPLTARVW
ncbi:MAG: DUF1549 domain-containing protein [Bryobacteraceae bacterium]